MFIEVHHRFSKDLADDHAGHVLQDTFIFICQSIDLSKNMTQLALTDLLGLIRKRHHDRTRGQIREAVLDDALRTLCLPFTETDIALDDILQIIDIVKRHMADITDRRLDVARHCDIDGDQRACLSLHHEVSDIPCFYDVLRSSGRCHDDIDIFSMLECSFERNRLAIDLLCEFFCFLNVTVCHNDLFETFALQILHQQLSRLTCPKDHGSTIVQATQDLLREFHRCIADRYRTVGNLRLRPHTLARTDRTVKESIQDGAGRFFFERHRVRRLDLIQDLALSDDHGVQT